MTLLDTQGVFSIYYKTSIGVCSMHRNIETGLCKCGSFDDSFLSYGLFGRRRSDQVQWLYLQHKDSCMRLQTLVCNMVLLST
jgi:hypothetical protein